VLLACSSKLDALGAMFVWMIDEVKLCKSKVA
jgi:hypothetical protein